MTHYKQLLQEIIDARAKSPFIPKEDWSFEDAGQTLMIPIFIGWILIVIAVILFFRGAK